MLADWDQQCFATFVSSTHPNLTDNEPEIELLWLCFQFYAFHPFAHCYTIRKIDFSAFQRAVTLLAVQGSDILGTQDEGDFLWRDTEAEFRQTDFRRIFRSLGRYREDRSESSDDHGGTFPLVEDVMDVLAMTQPFSIGLAPSPDQLERTARRLLDNDSTRTRSRVTRKDLSTLISLILRMKVEQTKWGPNFHFGCIAKGEPADGKLADDLIDSDRDEDDLVYLQVRMTIDMFVSIYAPLFNDFRLTVAAKFKATILPAMDDTIPASDACACPAVKPRTSYYVSPDPSGHLPVYPSHAASSEISRNAPK